MTLRYLTEYNFANSDMADFVLRLYNPYVDWVKAGKPSGSFADFDEIVQSLPEETYELSLITELVSSGLWEAFMSGVKFSEGYKAVKGFSDQLFEGLNFNKKYFKRQVGEAVFIYGEVYGRAIEMNASTLSEAFRAFVEAHSPIVEQVDEGVYQCDTKLLSDLAFARGIICFATMYTNMLERRNIAKIVHIEMTKFTKFELENPGVIRNRQEAHDACLKWASKRPENMDFFNAFKAILVWIRHFGPINQRKLERFVRKNVLTFGKMYPVLSIGLLSEFGEADFVNKWVELCAK